MGYLAARTEPGRTIYTLTERGRDAVRTWTDEPASFPRMVHEASVRVLRGSGRGRGMLASPRGMRAEVERALEDVAAMERQANAHPHRRDNLLVNHWLGRRWCELQLEWLDEAERALGRAD